MKITGSFFTVEETIPAHDIYFSQTEYINKSSAIRAAKDIRDHMSDYDKKRNIIAVYGWLKESGSYNPNTADEWKDPDVVVMVHTP